MSGDPRDLKATLLEEASTDQQKQFAKMLAEECAEAELRSKGHVCWMFIPVPEEYEIMRKYVDDDTCPQCKKGRIVLSVYHGNFGDSYWLICSPWGGGCGYKESATVDTGRW